MNPKKFKQYCLYLDESGDFEESEANLNSPSLVGGVFFQKESINEQAAEHIISQVRDKYVKKNEQYKAINYHHATELPVEIKADVKVGNNCFVGYGSILLPGVTIGDEVIVGAGSVVTKDVPSNSIVAGNPARVIREGVHLGHYGKTDKKGKNNVA